MSLLDALRHRLHVLTHPDRYAREVEEEMRLHLDLDAEQRREPARGPGGARHAARRRFGNPTYLKEEVRRAAGLAWLDATRRDARYAWRSLSRAPGYALLAIAVLGLGIGSTTAVYSIVDTIMLRGLPYRAADRLLTVYERSEDSNQRVPSYPTFLDWQAQSAAAHDGIEGFAFVRGDLVSLPGARSTDDADRRVAAYVTPGFFRLMGTHALLGRTFSPAEEKPGGPPVAVISWDLFRNRFGTDPGIVGRVVDVDSVPTTIIGVMPRAFAFPNFGDGSWFAPAMWRPIAPYAATHPQLSYRGLHADSRTVLRLRAGADQRRAVAALRIIEARLAGAYPVEQAHWTSVALQPIRDELFGGLPSQLVVVAAAVALVLLLACLNVANLMLVRASVRSRELTVRAALGAGRWRIARQLLAEALVLAALAGVLGLGLALALVGFARHEASSLLPFASALRVDGRAAAFATAACLTSAILVGVLPAWRAGGRDLISAVRRGGVGGAEGRREGRVRQSLVSLQFALAVTLLVGAGLLLQSFRRLASVQLGFDTDGIIQFAIAPTTHRYDDPAQAAALYARILDGVRTVPGVTAVAAAGGALMPTPVITDGAPADRPPAEGLYHLVSADYLRVMRVPLVAGRWFSDADMRAPNGVVISRKLARQLWPGASPLGRHITVHRMSQGRRDFGQRITLPVIGVVGDVRESGPAQPPDAEVYLPYTLEVWPWMSFVARANDAARDVPSVERAIHDVEPALRFRSRPGVLRTGAAAIDPQRRFLTIVLAGFALCALVLAATGMYGVVSYGVVQRARELGVRRALGAPASRVMSLVVVQSAAFVAAGAVLGVIGAWLGTSVIRGMLFDTAPTDAGTFVIVVLVLLAAALLASFAPARRASRVDPMIALRTE